MRSTRYGRSGNRSVWGQDEPWSSCSACRPCSATISTSSFRSRVRPPGASCASPQAKSADATLASSVAAAALLRSRPAVRRGHPRRTSQYHTTHTVALSTTA